MIEELAAAEVARERDALADLLHACVHDGASIGFVLPFGPADAGKFWQGVEAEAAAGATRLFGARRDGRLVGCVLLQLAMKANQRHRATIAKLLVHPAARRRGLGRALMAAAEAAAREEGRILLVLDTRTGDVSEALYREIGFEVAGVMPGYARHPLRDELEDCTVLFKRIA